MKFTVVRSSAGSGKTYTLVRKYLLFVLGENQPNYFRHILAITFTNKATNEMKSRIVEALEGLTNRNLKYKELLFDLSEKLSLKEEIIVSRSEVILNQLIHNYSDFSVSTIDRFVTRIIKSFSFELNIPAGFEIELDQQRILQKSVDALLDKITTNKDLEKLLVSFASYKFSTNKSFNLETDLLELAKEVNNSDSKHFVEQLRSKRINYSELRKSIFLKVSAIESQVNRLAGNLLKKIKEAGIIEEELAGGKRGIYGYLDKLSSASSELKTLTSVGMKIIDTGKWHSAKAGSSTVNELERCSVDFTNDLKELAHLIDQSWPLYNFCKIMMMRVDLMSIIYEIASEIELFKESNNLLQLEDFNERISSLINDSPVPYIYQRTGEKFNNYLIDEFQDTSQIQWYNLIPLVEESLSNGNESMIVGDEKQAIYRFRGGDINQMGRLPKLHFDGQLEQNYLHREALLDAAFKEDNLEYNYRSAISVVEFVNDYFQVIQDRFPELTNAIYRNHGQIVKQNDVEGSVHIKFLESGIEEEDRLEQMRQEVESYLSIGYNPGDIAILCRKAKQCSAVANYLMTNSYSVFSSESLKLVSSSEVQFLINWLRLPNSLDRKELEFSILNYLVRNHVFVGFTNDQLVEQWMNDCEFDEILKSFCPSFQFESLYSKSILEILSELTKSFLTKSELNPFVLGLIDRVVGFQEQFGNDRFEFIRWWDEKGVKLDVEMPSQNDSIQVMTIHKAKGLEFNVVVIPYLDDNISAGKDSLWVNTREEDKDLVSIAWLPMNQSLKETRYEVEYEEEMNKSFIDTLNVMYVALTRAAHHVSILSTNQKKKDNMWREDNLMWLCFSIKDYKGSEDNGEFFKGNLVKIESKKELLLDNTLKISSVSKFDWRKNIELKFKSDDVSLADSTLTAQEYGNLFHEIMSKVKTLSDLPKVMSYYVQNSLVNEEEGKRIRETIELTLSNQEINAFFVNDTFEVYNEREILSSNKALLRPDRMMIHDNKLILIDYKTGKLDQSHEEQIHTYIKALNEIGDFNITAFLIYFSTQEVRKVA